VFGSLWASIGILVPVDLGDAFRDRLGFIFKADMKCWHTIGGRHDWLGPCDYVAELGRSDRPSRFAETMAKTIPIEPNKTRLLDIGCGCGIIGIYCLIEKRAANVTFNDILPEMISVSRTNVKSQVRQGRILASQAAFRVCGFARMRRNFVVQHDLIEFNPPQLPMRHLSKAARRKITKNGLKRSFRFGGPDGLSVVRRFFSWYARLSGPKPDAVILLSSFLGRIAIGEAVREHGLSWKITSRTRVPLRPILIPAAERASAEERKDRSLKKGRYGDWTKELLTILLKPGPESRRARGR
jgi:SAM-dependent methyltransferase